MLKLHPSVVASRRSASLLVLAAAMLVPVAATAEEAVDEKKEVEALVVYGRGATANTTATGLDLTPRQTPQSLSIITRQQIEDQGAFKVTACWPTPPASR